MNTLQKKNNERIDKYVKKIEDKIYNYNLQLIEMLKDFDKDNKSDYVIDNTLDQSYLELYKIGYVRIMVYLYMYYTYDIKYYYLNFNKRRVQNEIASIKKALNGISEDRLYYCQDDDDIKVKPSFLKNGKFVFSKLNEKDLERRLKVLKSARFFTTIWD